MRNLWLSGLVLFCVVASGFILVQGRPESTPVDLASVAGGARDAVQEAAAQLGGRAEARDAEDDAGASFYRYTDETGTVRFVTSLAQVPAALRDNARPVANDRVQRAATPTPPPATEARRPVSRLAAPRALAASHEVVVYTTSWCGWCRKTLAFLDERGIDYENRDIEDDEEWRRELRQKTGGTSVPVVEIDGEIVRGYDPTRLTRLLRESS